MSCPDRDDRGTPCVVVELRRTSNRLDYHALVSPPPHSLRADGLQTRSNGCPRIRSADQQLLMLDQVVPHVGSDLVTLIWSAWETAQVGLDLRCERRNHIRPEHVAPVGEGWERGRSQMPLHFRTHSLPKGACSTALQRADDKNRVDNPDDRTQEWCIQARSADYPVTSAAGAPAVTVDRVPMVARPFLRRCCMARCAAVLCRRLAVR